MEIVQRFKVIAMVQKYSSPVRIYKYPFELVMKVNINLLINWEKTQLGKKCYHKKIMNAKLVF